MPKKRSHKMSFPTDWDIEAHKVDHECDEHWELRKSFMEAHKNDYPEDKLVCLAQVFTNIEFMGCRYPEETMQLVASLSHNVAADFREKRKSKLQRTFVKASDAAGAKAKGLRNNGANTQAFIPSKEDEPANKIPKIEERNHNETINNNTNTNGFILNKNQLKKQKLAEDRQRKRGDIPDDTDVIQPSGRWPGLVIVESATDREAPICVLNKSLLKCQAFGLFERYKLTKLDENSDNIVQATYLINNDEVTTATGYSYQKARENVAHKALQILKNHCYTIKVKKSYYSETTIDKTLEAKLDKELGEDNVGNKIMRLMGWSGGGLGKNEEGRTDNIDAGKHNYRKGLGATKNAADFCKQAETVMRDYIKGKLGTDDLVFSTEFDNAQRKSLHKIALKLNLQSQSHGPKNNRQLVISLKKQSTWKILQELLRGNTSLSVKYDLVHPTNETTG